MHYSIYNYNIYTDVLNKSAGLVCLLYGCCLLLRVSVIFSLYIDMCINLCESTIHVNTCIQLNILVYIYSYKCIIKSHFMHDAL